MHSEARHSDCEALKQSDAGVTFASTSSHMPAPLFRAFDAVIKLLDVGRSSLSGGGSKSPPP
jgi:hypothetical protein